MNTKAKCKHCGTPFRQGTGDFCCAGCAQVYGLIQASGLDEYYARQDRMGAPIRTVPFERRDFSWAETMQARAEAEGGASVALRVDGMSCLGCVWLVERLARGMSGVRSARVGLGEARLRLRWRPGEGFELKALAGHLQRFGYIVRPVENASMAAFSPLAWRLGLTGIFTVNGLLLSLPLLLGVADFAYADLFALLATVFAMLSFAVGAGLYFMPGWRALRRKEFGFDAVAALVTTCVLGAGLTVFFGRPQWVLGCALFSMVVFLLLFIAWVRTWSATKEWATGEPTD